MAVLGLVIPLNWKPIFVKHMHFMLHVLIGLLSYGILFVNLCLKVASPVSML